ncbi:MAG: GtrA family protein [Petrimonas sp.]|nr:GtrA family protein [Petrimonas sp.]
MLKHVLLFSKAQVSAFFGGIVDYGVMVFVTEVFHVHYTVSIAIGGIVGAIVNFTINKKWTFNSKETEYRNTLLQQLLKYFVTVTNSIILKSTGTYFLTTLLGIDYKISRIFADLVVSTCFNYTLQKQWVFKKVPNSKIPQKSLLTDPVRYYSKENNRK